MRQQTAGMEMSNQLKLENVPCHTIIAACRDHVTVVNVHVNAVDRVVMTEADHLATDEAGHVIITSTNVHRRNEVVRVKDPIDRRIISHIIEAVVDHHHGKNEITIAVEAEAVIEIHIDRDKVDYAVDYEEALMVWFVFCYCRIGE